MPSRASRSTPFPSPPPRASLPLRQPPPSPRSTTITSRGPRRIAGGGPCSLASSSRSVGTCIPRHADACCWRGRRSTPNLGDPPPAGVDVRQRGAYSRIGIEAPLPPALISTPRSRPGPATTRSSPACHQWHNRPGLAGPVLDGTVGRARGGLGADGEPCEQAHTCEGGRKVNLAVLWEDDRR